MIIKHIWLLDENIAALGLMCVAVGLLTYPNMRNICWVWCHHHMFIYFTK